MEDELEAARALLRREIEASSLRTVADRVGIDHTTLRTFVMPDGVKRPKAKTLEPILEYARKRLGSERLNGSPNPSDSTVPSSEDAPPATLPRVMAGLPYEVRVWLQHELLDYAKASVTDRELRAARDLFERPEVFSFYAGGVPQAHTEEEVLQGMRALAAAVRHTLRRRGYKLDADTPF